MNRIGYIALMIVCTAVFDLNAQEKFQLEPLSVNRNYSNEIFAISTEDGVIFCSDFQPNLLIGRIDTANRSLFHLYFAPKKDSVQWGIPQILSKNLPLNAHKGPFTISSNGRDIYFTVSDETGQKIFQASKSGDRITNMRPFAFNAPRYTTTHPSLSRDGQRLFFASDRPGGFGGFDLYVCEWTSRGWGQPKNLGDKVNTSENELYPFIQENGELFFSSKAHGSMGGMDIFMTSEINSEWATPQRMDEPINSTADDISYTAIDPEGRNGYLASNRNGKIFSIFSFASLLPPFPTFECDEQEENDYTYIFQDNTNAIMEMEDGTEEDFTPALKLVWELGDGTIKYGEEIEHTYSSTGQYEIFLNVIDTLTNQISNQVAHYVIDVEDIEQPYITVSETIQAGVITTFDASETNLPDVIIEDYYWMFGDGKRIKGGQRVEHIYAAPGKYRVQLGVIGKSRFTGVEMKICTYREITVK